TGPPTRSTHPAFEPPRQPRRELFFSGFKPRKAWRLGGSCLFWNHQWTSGSRAVEVGLVGEHEALDELALQDVALDDLEHVGHGHVSVPDMLRVNHHGHAVGALVEAAGVVGPHDPLEAERVQPLLELV